MYYSFFFLFDHCLICNNFVMLMAFFVEPPPKPGLLSQLILSFGCLTTGSLIASNSINTTGLDTRAVTGYRSVALATSR